MAERVTIEVEAKLIDNLTAGLLNAAAVAERLKNTVESIGKTGSFSGSAGKSSSAVKSAQETSKTISKISSESKKLSNTKNEVSITAKDNASQTISKVASETKKLSSGKNEISVSAKDNASATLGNVSAKAKQLGTSPYRLALSAQDNASNILGTVTAKARSFASGVYNAAFNIKDHVSEGLGKITSSLKNLVGKTWDIAVGIKDHVSSGLSKIFNLKNAAIGAATGLATGYVGQQLVAEPIALADEMTQAHIGFETMLGSSTQADDMMDEIKNYAKKTPFDTQGTISAVQQMLRAGWDKSEVIGDMEKIGNTAAAAGQGTAGVSGIVLALQQMKMSGRVYAQDMAQLVNRGVEAWQFLADGMGVSVQEVRKLSEDGAITADEAIGHIMKGMEKYDGMMDKMSNRTVSGILSNLKDTFEIGFVEKWGTGLQKAATAGLGKIAQLLDEVDPALRKAGTSLEKIGKGVGDWAFGKLDGAMNTIKTVLGSEEFKSAPTTVDKLKVAWKELVAQPIGDWFKTTSGNVSEWLGKTLGGGASNLLQAMFGADMSGVDGVATSIAGRFAEAFKSAFKGADVLSSIGDSLKGALGSLAKFMPGGDSPTAGSWLAAALGGGLLYKLGAFGGIGNLIKKKGGMSSILGNLGYTLSSKTAGGMSTLSSGGQLLLGTGAAVGGAVGLISLIGGINDLNKSFKTSNELEKKQNRTSGILKLAGTALGTVAGAVLGGPAGAAIGAGVGGAAGTLASSATDTIHEAGTGFKNTKKDALFYAGYGATAGTMIGSVAGPIGAAIGAAIGTGVGGLTGLATGLWKDKVTAKEALKNRYASEEMKSLVGDKNATTEEIEAAYQRAIKTDLDKHFGSLSLSLDEIESEASRIIYGNNKAAYEKFSNAAADTEANYRAYEDSAYSLEKQNWKTNTGLSAAGGSVGLKLSDDEVTSYKSTIDGYISDAKSYVEGQNYEFDAAVDILIKDNKQAAQYKTWGTNFYNGLQSDLDSTSKELTEKVNIALEDGEITSDEQAGIEGLQSKIQQQLDDLADTEMEAEMSAIKIKFGQGKLDYDSFDSMMKEVSQTGSERIATAEDAYKDVYKNALSMYKRGDILEPQFNEMIQSAAQGYQRVIDKVGTSTQKFGFENIAKNYEQELSNLDFGSSAAEIAGNMQKQLQEAFSNPDINPKSWSTDDIQKMFGLDKLAEMPGMSEAAANISNMIKSIIDDTPDGFKANPKVEIEPEIEDVGDIGAQLQEAMGDGEDLTVEKAVSIITQIDPTSEEAGNLNTEIEQAMGNGEEITIEKIVSLLTHTEIAEGSLGDTGDINARLKELVDSGEPVTVDKIIQVLAQTQTEFTGDATVDGSQVPDPDPVEKDLTVKINPKVEMPGVSLSDIESGTNIFGTVGGTIDGGTVTATTTVNTQYTAGETGTFTSPQPTTEPVSTTTTVNTQYTAGETGTFTAPTPSVSTVSATVPVNVNYSLGSAGGFTPPAPASTSVSQTYPVNVSYVDGAIGGYTPPTPAATSVSMSVGVNVSYYTASTSGYSAPSVGGNAKGGIVRGKQLSWLAEEGYPEAVIPFNPARRERALSLWAESGRRLGVLENADGGIVGTNGKTLPKKMSLNKSAKQEMTSERLNGVSIDVGGVQITVQSNDGQSLTDAIESNADAITETIARVMRKSARQAFANMSARR